jgi:septum formation protein
VDEDEVEARLQGASTTELVCALAEAKAEAVAASAAGGDADLVLGCDSMLDLDGRSLGKPADASEATQRWKRMRGRSGTLITGHCLIEPATGRREVAAAATVVWFAELSDDEITAYVATGEPLAVAGAFTVDGLGGAFVERIEGDHHNVVGISLPLLRSLLAKLDISWQRLWSDG